MSSLDEFADTFFSDDDLDLFRVRAIELGLSVTGSARDQTFKTGKRLFYFDLNQGPIELADPTPERVYQLVSLARAYADDASYGEHHALLGLVAQVKELDAGKQAIYWARAYHASHEGRISLAGWLRQHDINLDSIYS